MKSVNRQIIVALSLSLQCSIAMSNGPSAQEFTGRYNVSPIEYGDAVGDAGYFNTQPNLKRPTFQEVEIITDSVLEVGRKLQVREGELYFDLSSEDRTVRISPRDPLFLTVKFVECVQTLVLESNPLWRAIVPMGVEKNAFAIYPQQVVFSREHAKIESELVRIREQEIEWFDSRDGVHDRQIEWVKDKLLSMPLPSRPFKPMLIAAFATWKGDTNYHAIWFLEDGYAYKKKTWFRYEKELDDDGLYGKADQFDVDLSGNIQEYLTTGDKFLGCLTCQVYVAKKFAYEVQLHEPETQKVEKRQIKRLHSDKDVLNNLQTRRSK